MAGMLWVTDREPAVRLFFRDLLSEAEILTPEEVEARLALRQQPDALVIDGTQLLELPPALRSTAIGLPRVLICTGLMLGSLPRDLITAPGVAVLAKPFCVEDLEAALEWLRGTPTPRGIDGVPFGSLVQRRRPRSPRRRLPAR
jgi:hypothetical protein